MHATVLVVTKEDSYVAVDEAMWPFYEEREDAVDPEWDWWVIGGRWADSPLIRYDGTTGLSVRKDELDLEAMSAAYFTPWHPHALLSYGEWHNSSPRYSEVEEVLGLDPEAPIDWEAYKQYADTTEAMWPRAWLWLMAEVPGDAFLTLVDYHF